MTRPTTSRASARASRRSTDPDAALKKALQPRRSTKQLTGSQRPEFANDRDSKRRSGQKSGRTRSARPDLASPTIAASPLRRNHRPSGGTIAAPWFVGNTRRLRLLTVLWIVLFGLMFAQMASLQLRNPGSATERVNRQRIRATRVAAERGDLVDRNGVPLAISVREWRLVADPEVIAKAKLTEKHTASIAARLGVDPLVIAKRLAKTGRYVIVARGLDEAKADAFRRGPGRLDGVAVEEEPRRVYPAGDLARGVLGSVRRSDQVGVSGLEKQFDSLLQGREGEMKVERDLKGGQIPTAPGLVRPAKRGASYQLTIDRSLQYSSEGILAQAVKLTGARSGIVMISDVRTGALLAVVNLTVTPDGSIANTGQNCAFVCSYELGSVSKAVTIAAALEAKVVSPTTRIVVPDRLQIWDKKFKDDESHKTMSWTPGEILVNSSNIGTIKIARLLGRDRLSAYLRSFGFGAQTNVGFPGEASGILPKPSKWSGTSIGTISIGQGIASTPAQFLDAYNTIANGGQRVPLRLVQATIDAQGKSHPVKVAEPRRVVSAETASALTKMLTEVVRSGTGTSAAFEGYSVAGKTGTAQKPDETGGYSKTKYVATFAGFFPAERPVLSAIAILDEPKTSIYGGHVAAPLFSEIGRMAAAYERVPPSPGRRAQTRPEAPKNERSLAYQRSILRGGALTLAPATPREIARSAAGTVRSTSAEATPMTPASTPASLPTEMAVIDPATGKVIVGRVVPRSPATPSVEISGVGVAPTVPPGAVATAVNTVPTINGIPDLSVRAYDLQVRPRAKSTISKMSDGATEHDGVARPPAGSAADLEARLAGNLANAAAPAPAVADSQTAGQTNPAAES
jgi:cell division protein FtsI (penicillin-binding protein 3)